MSVRIAFDPRIVVAPIYPQNSPDGIQLVHHFVRWFAVRIYDWNQKMHDAMTHRSVAAGEFFERKPNRDCSPGIA